MALYLALVGTRCVASQLLSGLFPLATVVGMTAVAGENKEGGSRGGVAGELQQRGAQKALRGEGPG